MAPLWPEWEGATRAGEEMLVKAAHGWEVWLCSIPRCGEEGDDSPRWLRSGAG